MGSPFEIQTKPQQVSYAVEEVQPPTGLAVTTNDNLVIKVHNSNAAPGLRVFVRLLLPDGTIAPNDFPIVPDATRAVNTFSFPLDEGFILSAVVFSTAANVFRGQCYVRLLIFRGSLTQQFVGYMLAEGYVTTATSLGFPTGPQEYAFSGRGVIRSITGTVPAAGAEITETVPTNAIWRLLTFRYVLTSSAAAGTRTSKLSITDGTNTLATTSPVGGLTPSSNFTYIYGATVHTINNQDSILWTYLGAVEFLAAGFRIQTLTGGILAGDQYTQIQYLVEEWIQP